MRSDWASVPTRGSRLAGLLSMIITSVLGSVRLEQEINITHDTKRRTINHRGHRGTQRSFLVDRKLLRAPLHPLWLNIRNLPQHHRFIRPGGGRNISRQPVPALKRQQGKGHSFLGLAGNAKIIRMAELEPQRARFFIEPAHEWAIPCS